MHRLGQILKISVVRFFTVSGSDHAAAFAFYAFFSLFPVVLLLVSFASLFIDQETATESITHSVREFLPLDDDHRDKLAEMIQQVVDNRGPARFVGFLSLIWAGLRFFKSLVHVQNLIWHCREVPWWHNPMKSATLLAALASALLLGVVAPTILQAIQSLSFVQAEWLQWIFAITGYLIPPLVLFYGLFLFYKLSPQTSVSVRDVWLPAVFAATMLTLSRKGLIALIHNTIDQVSVYDTIGVVIAVLWSIYLSGLIIIFSGCLGAAIHETRPENDTGIV